MNRNPIAVVYYWSFYDKRCNNSFVITLKQNKLEPVVFERDLAMVVRRESPGIPIKTFLKENNIDS